jgi:transcriptional regulator with XRE-family HTH domain
MLTEKGASVPRGRYKGPVDDKGIGKTLREIREAQGMTQVEIAEELGINQSLISEYEKGSVRLHAPLLAGMAKVLSVSSDEILGLSKTKRSDGLKDRRFMRRLRRIELLPSQQQEAVLKLLDGVLESHGANSRR